MENKPSKSGLFVLLAMLLGLAFVFYYLNNKKSNKNYHRLHQYDYIMEVNGDSIPTYNIYDQHHNMIAKEILASQLDSVIISDNE